MSSRSDEKYACDMRSYAAYYEKQLAAIKKNNCSKCTRECLSCIHSGRIKELQEDIDFCNGEVDRYTHEYQIAKRRKHYKNTKALCDTNIRKGTGFLNAYHKGMNNFSGTVWATKL